jgi:hypothetical protein
MNGGKMEDGSGLVIYDGSEGGKIEVRLENDSIWLSLNQIAKLFGRDKSVISRHIKNIFETEELTVAATVAKYATVQKEAVRSVEREIEFYNLDLIISVGYRVNSKRGTQFRIWANGVLKDYLSKGYSLNERKLRDREAAIKELKTGLELLSGSVLHQAGRLEEARDMVKIVADFARGFTILDDYDYGRLDERKSQELCRADLPDLWCGDLYPSIEEKAACLLFLVVKNHSFVDGNKRIAAALFIYFLDRNGLLYSPDGSPLISGETLAALTLMIAESKTGQMDILIRIIISVINRSRAS